MFDGDSPWYINNGNETMNPQVKQNFSKNIHCQVFPNLTSTESALYF